MRHALLFDAVRLTKGENSLLLKQDALENGAIRIERR